jgi:hypothetical protein
MRSRSDFLVVLGFCAALLAPALAWRVDPGAWVALERENRRPAPFPELPRDPAALRSFPPAFEAWQADTLGLRSGLLRLDHLLALRGWQKLPSQTLLLGRAGWIFYTGEESRAVWRGLYPIPRDYAANWIAALRSRAAWFARRGIAYLYVIAPNKETVYPDELPQGEEALGRTLLDLIGEQLAAHPDLPLLDLRAALAQERTHDRPQEGDFVFHPYGTHWTARAGWCAAQAIAGRLAELHPELRRCIPPAREECVRQELPAALEDSWAASLRLEDVCTQRVYAFRARTRRAESCSLASEDLHTHECLFERPDGEGERLLLVHDSFGPWLREPLAELGARLRTLWEEDLPLERILADAPRVVVELRTERRLRDPALWLYDPFESLAPEAFAALPELARRPASAESIGGVASYAGSRIERDAAGPGLRVFSPEGAARVLLDGWQPGPGGRLALHLVLRVPETTQATIWYQTRDEPRFHPRRRNVMLLAPGSNELCLRLPEAGIEGPLLFQPGEVAGEYLIERLEARSGVR